jgi:hypothetical protein
MLGIDEYELVERLQISFLCVSLSMNFASIFDAFLKGRFKEPKFRKVQMTAKCNMTD